jgi:mono/diheme cytochrome c family protein
MKKLIVIFIVFALLSTTFSFIMPQDDKWKVPEKYEKMKNPVVADQASINAGLILYNDHCRSCHGKDGKGDGIKARNLNTAPANFTSDAFQKQSDGALLYKIYFGHKDMPGFKTRIPDNKDVIDGAFGKTRTPGDLINYLHTFAKNSNSLSSRNK